MKPTSSHNILHTNMEAFVRGPIVPSVTFTEVFYRPTRGGPLKGCWLLTSPFKIHRGTAALCLRFSRDGYAKTTDRAICMEAIELFNKMQKTKCTTVHCNDIPLVDPLFVDPCGIKVLTIHSIGAPVPDFDETNTPLFVRIPRVVIGENVTALPIGRETRAHRGLDLQAQICTSSEVEHVTICVPPGTKNVFIGTVQSIQLVTHNSVNLIAPDAALKTKRLKITRSVQDMHGKCVRMENIIANHAWIDWSALEMLYVCVTDWTVRYDGRVPSNAVHLTDAMTMSRLRHVDTYIIHTAYNGGLLCKHAPAGCMHWNSDILLEDLMAVLGDGTAGV